MKKELYKYEFTFQRTVRNEGTWKVKQQRLAVVAENETAAKNAFVELIQKEWLHHGSYTFNAKGLTGKKMVLTYKTMDARWITQFKDTGHDFDEEIRVKTITKGRIAMKKVGKTNET